MRNSGTWLRNVESVLPSPEYWRLVVACFVLSCAWGGPRLAAQNASSEATAPASIHGTVINRVTNEPVSRALVYSTDEMYATLTDDRGRFEFKFPPPEPPKNGDASSEADSPEALALRYARNSRPTTYMARKPGFLSGGNVNAGDETDQETGVSATSPEMTIYLDPEALIVGRVLFSSADSTTRIRVELYERIVLEGQEKWESR